MSQRTPSKRAQGRRARKAYGDAAHRREVAEEQPIPMPPLFSDREMGALVDGLEEIVRNPDRYRHLDVSNTE